MSKARKKPGVRHIPIRQDNKVLTVSGTQVVAEIRASEEDWEDNEDEPLFWPRTIWIDPGTISGISIVWFDPAILLDNKQPSVRSVMGWWAGFVRGPENDQVKAILSVISALDGSGEDANGGCSVGCESFDIRRLDRSYEFLSPVRIFNKLEYPLWSGSDGLRRRPLLSQTAADAKHSAPDPRLRAYDMWVPGADHARDAIRHSLLYLKRLRVLARKDLRSFVALHGREEDWGVELPDLNPPKKV